MDDNQIFERFDKIEEKLSELLEVRSRQVAKIAELEEYIAQLENELQEKIEIEERLIEERSFVRSRIDNLLDKMESAETSPEKNAEEPDEVAANAT